MVPAAGDVLQIRLPDGRKQNATIGSFGIEAWRRELRADISHVGILAGQGSLGKLPERVGQAQVIEQLSHSSIRRIVVVMAEKPPYRRRYYGFHLVTAEPSKDMAHEQSIAVALCDIHEIVGQRHGVRRVGLPEQQKRLAPLTDIAQAGREQRDCLARPRLKRSRRLIERCRGS
jgi:hypothetical protein